MIDDFRNVDANAFNEVDICIVGTGAAGISLAREFIGSRLKICILESGGLEFDPAIQSLYNGENTCISMPLSASRMRFFGGTTNAWINRCAPLNDIDFKQRSWVPGSGWPFRRADLESYYERARDLCGLQRFVYDERSWGSLGIKNPLLLLPQKLATHFWQFGQPIVRFGKVYRAELKRAKNIQVLLHANVIQIDVNESASIVESLKISTLAGKIGRLKAKHYIIACGGIENARLLLASDKVEASGLGNRYDLVGRYFMEHPRAYCGQVITDKIPVLERLYNYHKGGRFLSAFQLSEKIQRKEQVGNCVMSLHYRGRLEPDSGIIAARKIWRSLRDEGEFPNEFGQKIWRVAKDIDDLIAAGFARLGDFDPEDYKVRTIRLFADIEQAPNPNSRVSLSRKRDALGQRRFKLNWCLSELDRRTTEVLTRVVGTELGRLGLGRVRIYDWLIGENNDWDSHYSWAAHHMGTTRMNDNPKEGVVDRNCRVHGVSNLYIAGSSVFPTSGHANPTYTIVALALRLADHLKHRML